MMIKTSHRLQVTVPVFTSSVSVLHPMAFGLNCEMLLIAISLACFDCYHLQLSLQGEHDKRQGSPGFFKHMK